MTEITERRSHERKRVRMQCYLETMSGGSCTGHTRDISLGGVFIEVHSNVAGRGGASKPGDQGLITLHFSRKGIPDSLKMRTRIVRVAADGMGLSINATELTDAEQETLETILRLERANI